MFECDIDNCTYKTKNKAHIKQHKAEIHNINVKWFSCDINDCNYKCKRKWSLKVHKQNVHNINVEWFYCNINNCKYKCKKKYHLKKHKTLVHNIDVEWFYCNIEECNFKCKLKYILQSHEREVHKIGQVQWFKCDIENCTYKCQRKYSLKLHKSQVHNINVKWFPCDVDGCTYRAKTAADVKKHKMYGHDIGKYQCTFCLKNRNSSISYKDNQGIHKICKTFYKKVTGRSSRIEHIWSDYIDENLGTEYLAGSDTSLKQLGGCQRYRPDKLYIGIDLVELDECDEHQHLRSGRDYSCDEKRISDIYEEEGICGKQWQ